MNIISSLFSFIANKIGNVTMGTEATTLTGAIAEHEGDITVINNKVTAMDDAIKFNGTKSAFVGQLQAMNGATSKIAMFAKQSYSDTTGSVAGGGHVDVRLDLSGKTGYTPFAIVGIQITGSSFYPYAFTISGTEAVVYVKNTGSTASSTNVRVTVLFIATTAF